MHRFLSHTLIIKQMKQILLFLSLLLPVIVAKAQKDRNLRLDILKKLNFWSLSGNSNARTSSKLGTTNAISFGLFTNNIERMRITASGDVGIGTATPQQKLDVNGNLNIAAGSGFYINNERVIYAVNNSFFAGLGSGTSNIAGEPNSGAGDGNTGIGAQALHNNTTGSGNTASGYLALVSNTTGIANTASGVGSLYANTIGESNVSSGVNSLESNTVGNFNVAVGRYALDFNLDGYGNVASGFGALESNVNGSYNTGIGGLADVNSPNLTNSTAIGNLAIVTASNQVRIGSNVVTSIGGFVDWTNISDGRVKKNITENVPGLAFINKLKPVTYNLNLDAAAGIIESGKINEKYTKTLPTLPGSPGIKIAESGKVNMKNSKALVPSAEELAAIKIKEQKVYTGFVAQDVEKAAKELNYDFSGVDAAKNDKDLYGLRYSEFVVPLVKAVQELSTKNDEKDKLISNLQNQIDELKLIVSGKSNNTSITSVTGYLKQNVPNPANNNTVIGYYLPNNTGRAQIIIKDDKGSTLKVYTTSKGEGQINIRSSELPAGTYNYSLYVNDKRIDSKQMVITR
jgi:hypothetical protein